MPDVIDLISSDPPLPERPRPEQTCPPSHQPLSRRPSRLGLISSDSIDVSLFTYDDLDKPAKKRRVSTENPSPLRQATTAREYADPGPASSFQFSDDDFGLPPSNPAALKKQPARGVEESDPIVFTSSALESASRYKPSVPHDPIHEPSDVITVDDDNDDLLKVTGNENPLRFTQESIEEFSDPFSIPGFADMMGISQAGKSASISVFSNKTAGLLSNLSATGKASKGKPTSKSGLLSHKNKGAGMEATAIFDLSDEVDEPVEPRRSAKKSTKMTTEEKEAKAKARAEAKAQRDRERQLEKERKQQLREEKTKQKQLAADIAEVNKLKVDKKDSTPEMVLDMASSLEETSVGNQTIEFMKRLGVEHTFFSSPIPNVVKWRRKMNAKFNEAAGHWEPCPSYVQEEKHVLCLVPAQDFVDLVIPSPDGEERESLELHVLKIKSAHPDCKPIYLIEGLTIWMRKNRNSRNRAYTAEVLRQYEQPNNEPSASAPRSRGRKPKNKPETTPPVDDDTIEDALLTLQVTHSCLIHHSNAPPESAEWIKNFTEHISTIPYRRERMEGNDASFCMDTGQVKTGEDKLDTFVKMLQEVNRVTASMAYGIAGQYPCVTDLVRGMRMHGPSTLEDVRKSANKNGALTDSRIGPAASKRLFKVFTGLDSTSTDV
ncbi:uncharacterized protein N7459_003238 [Penicillium hispanicum]|uniref:uncharacterized protein n=1 Tax=Penicillium hispanicum TaxID=1080232 RepID=UPI00254238AF|nr:uncharacterized protein N7459_003238 [Penicillium hispanicum]KAJ5587473.1 hypothetical protein N7459_003238 [Penicillium hispanicum]